MSKKTNTHRSPYSRMGDRCVGPGGENQSLGVLSENAAKDEGDKWETETARIM